MIMSIFKRSGKVPGDPTSVDPEEMVDPVVTAPKKTKMSLEILTTEVEKMGARIEALNEMKTVMNERFSRIDERIGQLRESLVEREKEIGEIEVKAIKAYDMVNLIHPEKLAVDLQKRDVKIESTSERLNATKKVLDAMITEVKEFRKKFSAFRGIEEIMKLNSEVKSELTSMRTTQARIDVDASKIENMFIDIQKKYAEMSKLEDSIKNVNTSISDVLKQFNQLKVKSEGLAEKKTLEELKKYVKSQTSVISGFSKKGESFQKFTSRVSNLEAESQKSRQLLQNLNTVVGNLSGSVAGIAENTKSDSALSEKMDTFTRNYDKKIEDMLDVIESYAEKIGTLNRKASVHPFHTPSWKVPEEEKPSPMEGEESNSAAMRTYIRACLRHGHSREKVKEALRNAGYAEEDILEAMNEL